nr:hypothetical protein CTI12_AA081420 [Tanacetum cinerariifolium]
MAKIEDFEVLTKETQQAHICLGYNVVPPPYRGNFLPPEPNLSGLEEFVNESKVSEPTVKKPIVKTSEAKASADKPKVERKNFGLPLFEDWISNSEDEVESKSKIEKETVKPSFAKIKFVKSKEQVKSPRKTTVKQGIKELKTNSDVQDFVRGGYENKWFVDLLYYCPIRTPLNVGMKELKTDSDVQDFVRVGYENKWDYLDESVLETKSEALDDPDDAHIDPIHKAQKGVLKAVGVLVSIVTKRKKIKKSLFPDEDAESSKSAKSAPKSSKKGAKSTKSVGKPASKATKALYNHEGGLIEHYGKLWDYRQALLESNTGSTCRLEVEELSSGMGELFYAKMDDLKCINLEAYEYLVSRNPNSWCRAFFSLNDNCAAFENGISKSYHKVILVQRSKPIITMLENIRIYIMQRNWYVFLSAYDVTPRQGGMARHDE